MKLDDVDMVSIAYSFVHKRTFFEFSIAGDITSSLEELKDKKLKLELKKDTHRSLNSNRIFMVFTWRTPREVKDTKGRYIQAVCLQLWFV